MPTLAANLLSDVNKYSPDQARDDHGRWGSAAGAKAADASHKAASLESKHGKANSYNPKFLNPGQIKVQAAHEAAALAHTDAAKEAFKNKDGSKALQHLNAAHSHLLSGSVSRPDLTKANNALSSKVIQGMFNGSIRQSNSLSPKPVM